MLSLIVPENPLMGAAFSKRERICPATSSQDGSSDLACFFVFQDHITCKKLGHAGGVVLNTKLLEMQFKWQVQEQRAIALGHPTGISGARILVTAYYALKRMEREFCVASICGGGGVTTAMVIRRES